MQRIHVIGRKNHGKTQLIVELVEELTSQGLRVGTIKHTHHSHELDVPGKDSHRHRTAGAAVVGILSPGMHAVYLPAGGVAAGDERYASLATMFHGCDLVIVEGDTQTSAPKMEVWRAAVGTKPLSVDGVPVQAVVTNDSLEQNIIQLPRDDIKQVASWVLSTLLLST